MFGYSGKDFAVVCPACGKARWFHPAYGPLPPEDGNNGYSISLQAQDITGRQRPNLHTLEGWCEGCAASILVPEAQAIAEAAAQVQATIADWLKELKARAQQWALESMARESSPTTAASALKAAFPVPFHACFEDVRCELHPEYVAKMKKRFRIQVGRAVEEGGFPLPKGLQSWLEAQVAAHPFAVPLQELHHRIDLLASTSPGPWPIARLGTSWMFILANGPIHRLSSTQAHPFFPDENPAHPYFQVEEATPDSIQTRIFTALASPVADPNAFLDEYAFTKSIRRIIEARVDLLTWPLPC